MVIAKAGCFNLFCPRLYKPTKELLEEIPDGMTGRPRSQRHRARRRHPGARRGHSHRDQGFHRFHWKRRRQHPAARFRTMPRPNGAMMTRRLRRRRNACLVSQPLRLRANQRHHRGPAPAGDAR